MSKEDLESITCGRSDLISEIVTKFKTVSSTNLPVHVLLVGQRGIGKTHTLLTILHALEKQGGFKTIRLSEEEYSVTSVNDFLKRILEELHIEFDVDVDDIESKALSEFNRLKQQKQFPVIFVDNLQMLFKQIRDLPKLRSLLQEHNPFCIMGSALSIFEEIESYGEPFYNFLDIKFLKGFTVKEITELIKKRLSIVKNDKLLTDLHENIHRIEGLHILTGGNPRLIHYLCEIIIQKNSLMDLESNIISLLDQLTPFYQMRMEKLSTTHRKIVDTLSKEDGPISPTSLAKIMQSDRSSVITQLRRLELDGVVETIKFKNKKETLYQLTERLYRIWREMRSPKGVKRIHMLVDFLKIWYTFEERRSEYLKYSNKLDMSSRITVGVENDLKCTLYLADTMGLVKIIDLPNLIRNIIDIDGYESARNEVINMDNEKKKYLDNLVVYLVYDVFITHTKCIIASKFDKYGNIDHFNKERNLSEEKLTKAIQNNKLIPDDRNLLHLAYEVLALFYAHNDTIKSEKYNTISSKMLDSPCHVNNIVTCNILAHERKYEEALKFISTLLKKHQSSQQLILEKLFCMSQLGKKSEVEKLSIIMINKFFDDIDNISDVLFISGMADLNLLSKILKTIEKNLSNFDKTLQKEHATLIARHLSFCAGILLIQNKLIFVDKIFHTLGNLINEYNIDPIQISVDPLKKLIENNSLNHVDTFMKKLLDINSEFKNVLLPIISALNYIKTKDTDILEHLHKEYRELTLKIILSISPKTIIPPQVTDSL